MMRAIASAAILGALIAGAALCASRAPFWRSMIAAPLPMEIIPAAEAWPICSTMTALGSESDWAQLDPDFAAGKRALVAEDWTGAITALKLAVLRDPRNADLQNYIGYAYRRLRQWGPAMGHYQQALMLKPRHRSAHEHLGELYLVLDEPIKAEEQRAALTAICLVQCDELPDLERAIAAYTAAAAHRPIPTPGS
jgi:tetratricopeptide (TPR) repeat protein